ncbi:restriction endonuclease subunit S [Photobacterium gaetbulicola]|uniref:Putative restriction modification system DNA specificity subunit n=1 Tax=Photobacterium gaetbulicola Gung47 TaxID=658445 RepID=A0A0C5WUZ3_9GAMM|nr:restriction endonuclease subunit S [Photobacterium gaetbulicola]AJR06880.1 putative restriction modification system DNA specificity subunit [Photobacterium gaetbulicola Gung47]PSU02848.1 restriction endonuclease subunit S [Photobacterium gaetbulicola]
MSDSVPNDWLLFSISDICNGRYGVVDGPFGSNLKSEHYRESGIPVFQSGFVTSNRFVKKNYVYVDKEKYEEQIRSSAGPGDILMAKIGMNAGACAIIPDGHPIGLLAGNSLKMSVNEDIASNCYLVHHLHFMQQSGEIRKLLTETAQPAISITTLKKHYVPLPPLLEQKKIASTLTSVDDVIEKTQAQIGKLKDLKTGMMQELLTRGVGVDGKPHTEFKDSPVGRIPKGWDVCLLDKVAKRGSGHTPDKKKPEYWNDGIKWVSLTDSSSLDKLYITDTSKKISQLGIENSSATLHPTGTVVMARDAGIGKSAITRSPMAVSQHFMAWVCGDRLDNYYLYYLLQYWKPKFEAIAMGSTIKTIGLPYFKKLQVPLPKMEEQQLISNSLKSVDGKIFALERKHLQLINTKKALMQDLLTGKVRVKVDS